MEGRGARGPEQVVSVVGSDLFYVLNRLFLPRFSTRASWLIDTLVRSTSSITTLEASINTW